MSHQSTIAITGWSEAVVEGGCAQFTHGMARIEPRTTDMIQCLNYNMIIKGNTSRRR